MLSIVQKSVSLLFKDKKSKITIICGDYSPTKTLIL